MTREQAMLEALRNTAGQALDWRHGFEAGWEAIQSQTCTWTPDEESVWDTDCGHRFETAADTPSENDMAWCCFCGRKLVEAK